jgi:glycosyltransferase involved in cell wall biosynthesis
MRILAWVVLILWIVSFLRTIVNLALVHRLRGGQALPPVGTDNSAHPALLSVIVPARNEEQAIERTVRALLAQTYPALEIVVIDDHSVDATGAILQKIAAEDSRLITFRGEDTPPGWLGKTWALHQGSRRAKGELLLFVDADVIYEPEAIAAMVARIEETGVSMLALFPRLGMKGFWEHVAMPNLAVMFFTVVDLWLANRTRIPLLGIGGGPGNLVRRADYENAGGHEALKDAVVDDVALGRLMRRAGFRTEAVRGDDLVFVHMYHGLREVIDGFTKNAFTTFGRSYAAAVVLSAGSLIVHVLPYVMMFTGDPLWIASVVLATLTRIILFSSLGYRLDNAIFGNPLMILLWTWILLRSTWITGVRRQLHWRGRTYDASRTRFGAD